MAVVQGKGQGPVRCNGREEGIAGILFLPLLALCCCHHRGAGKEVRHNWPVSFAIVRPVKQRKVLTVSWDGIGAFNRKGVL